MKYLIIIALVAVGIFFLFFNVNVNIDHLQSSAMAEEAMPSGVTKFKDGHNTCYRYENVWLSTGGISCVKGN